MVIVVCYMLLQILFCIYMIAVSWVQVGIIAVSVTTTVLASLGIFIHALLLLSVFSNEGKSKTKE